MGEPVVTNETSKNRDAVLVERMQKIVETREPRLAELFKLNTKKDSEWMRFILIGNSLNPIVKADLTKMLVDDLSSKSQYFESIFTLACAKTGELGLDGYGEEYARDLYNNALGAKKFKEALGIAKIMRDLPVLVMGNEKPSENWKLMEKSASKMAEKNSGKFDTAFHRIKKLSKDVLDVVEEGMSMSHPWNRNVGQMAQDAVDRKRAGNFTVFYPIKPLQDIRVAVS